MIINTIQDYDKLSFDEGFVFRGQSKESYELLPSAYRDDNLEVQGPKFEIFHVCDFFHYLRQKGFYAFQPDDNEYDVFIEPYNTFPTNRLRPYLALAQHYAGGSQGSSHEFRTLKTSLLDVTHNLDIAAYFAVSADNKNNGKIFIIDPEKIEKPYIFYEPRKDFRAEDFRIAARIIIQEGAFFYREQEYKSSGEAIFYKNSKPFNDIIEDIIIIPDVFKADLKKYLQDKLFDLLLYPRLILEPMVSDMSNFGKPNEESLIWKKQEIEIGFMPPRAL